MSRPDIIAAKRLPELICRRSRHGRAGRPFARRRGRGRFEPSCLEDARADWMALGVVGVEQAVGRGALDDLRQLPAEVHRVLDAEVQALAPDRRMHVCGVAGEEHAASR